MGKSVDVILAAGIGLVAGLLLAPKSGKETRQDLMDKKDELQDKTQRGLETVKKGASSIKTELKSNVDDVKDIAEEPTR